MLLSLNNKKYKIDFSNTESDINITYVDKTNTEIETQKSSLSFIKNNNSIVFFGEDNTTDRFYIAQKGNKFYAFNNGEYYYLEEVDEVVSFGNGANVSINQDLDIIKSPMPGTIVKVLVEENQEVKEGDAVIIIEAMKMETTLYSSIDGKVSEINAKEKEQVDTDVILVKIEK